MRKFSDLFKLKNLFLSFLVFFIVFFSVGCTQISDAKSIGIIGGADEPTAIMISNQKLADFQGKEQEKELNKDERISEILNETLKVHFIDVGQADSILIQQGDQFMLIDGGNNEDSDLLVNYLNHQGVKDIKYVIGTHPHEDHIGGLDAVINSFNIETVMMPKVTANTKTFEDVLQAIDYKKLKITSPKVGETYDFGEAHWMVLAPTGTQYHDLNNYSIVISYVFGDHTFLFTGDAEELSEFEILKESTMTSKSLKADVLKVGHHGSNSSTSQAFLNAVNPNYAVISVGSENEYGHPHIETINRLNKKNIEVLRTDLSGNIIFNSNGTNLDYTVQNEAMVSYPVVTDITDKSIEELVDTGIIISDLDKKGETVTVKNTSNMDVDLSDWYLLSVTGNQKYLFPKGYILKSKRSVILSSGDSMGTLQWTKKNIWNNSKSDPAELYDNKGNLVYRFDD